LWKRAQSGKKRNGEIGESHSLSARMEAWQNSKTILTNAR